MLEKLERTLLNIDVFYSNKDITSLRWLSEIKYEISKYRTSLIFRICELSSDYAKKCKITSELILVNNKIISLHQLRDLMQNHLLE